MKILMVAIPNHHFFQWVNQLKESGNEVYWFDISDGGNSVDRINWVHQIKGWKLKYDYPLRHFIKNKFPRIYNKIQKYNENKVATVFANVVNEIQPDVVHCFVMSLAGLPILGVMNQNPNLKFIYSSWGSDVYFYKQMGVQEYQFKQFLQRVDYLLTDCNRDYEIVKQNGFKNIFLGAYIGNGGLTIESEYIQAENNRNILMIKGYEDGVGMALKVIDAIELVPLALIKNLRIIIYSADNEVKERIENSAYFTALNVTIYIRGKFISNPDLLKLMGKSVIHVANSTSDGLPTSAVEAMGMGAFPIQSNPGKVSEEVIEHGINGYLIENPFDSGEIANWIKIALGNKELRVNAQKQNVDFVNKNFNREKLKPKIEQLYKSVLN